MAIQVICNLRVLAKFPFFQYSCFPGQKMCFSLGYTKCNGLMEQDTNISRNFVREAWEGLPIHEHLLEGQDAGDRANKAAQLHCQCCWSNLWASPI